MIRCTDPIRIGEWTFDPEAHTLRRAGRAEVHLEPRLAKLLRRLADAQGRVLRREDLLDDVWDEAAVGEEALTQAVSLLRRALGDSARRQGYVQTIPKKGYRLEPRLFAETGPPQASASDGSPTVTEVAARAASMGVAARWGYLTAAAVLGLGLAVLLVSGTDSGTAAPRRPSVLDAVTALPGRESQPRLSPDGTRVAFVWNGSDRAGFDVYTITLGESVPRRLTATPELELSPTWSPDGARIAFARVDAETCRILVLTLASGGEREVSRCGAGSFPELDWAPRGDRLAVSDTSRPPGSYTLSILDLRTGARRPLTTPIDGLGDRSPAFSPDGRELAYVRTSVMSASRLLVTAVDGGAQRALPTVGQAIAGVAWDPSGRSLVFAADRGGEFGLWRVSVDGTQPTWLGVPVAGPVRPSTARRGNLVVFEQQRFDSDLWSLDPSADEPPHRWADSTRWDQQPGFSPDGRHVAFVSSRSGQPEVWIAAADGSEPRQLTRLRHDRLLLPRWSPDGTRVLFTTSVAGQAGLYVATVASGVSRRIIDTPSSELAGAWTGDGKGILFVSDRGDGWGVWKADDRGRDPRPLLPVPAGTLWADPRGDGIYYSRMDRAGIWHLPPSAAEARQITDRLSPDDWANWAVTRTNVIFLDRTETGPGILRAVDLRSGREHALASVPMVEGDSGLAISPATGHVIFARADREESDILAVSH